MTAEEIHSDIHAFFAKLKAATEPVTAGRNSGPNGSSVSAPASARTDMFTRAFQNASGLQVRSASRPRVAPRPEAA